MKKLLSGIQPTGHLHLGNYLGAIQNWVKLINKGKYETFIFIADLHSITIPQDPKLLKENVILVAATYIACGIDPAKCNIFTQSAMPEHSELAWILACFTPTGWMNRMTQFKEKSERYKENSSLGLYMYPILMAADILIYNSDVVPVGEDQKQHLELARDVAQAFNRATNTECFKMPEPIIIESTARIKSLRDGTKKMSKSDDSDFSRINLTDSPEEIRSKFKKAKSDSIQEIYHDKDKRPEVSNLLNIYSALSGKKVSEIQADYQGKNFSTFKEDIAEVTINALGSISKEIHKLIKEEGYIREILEKGRAEASEVASENLKKTKKIVGLL